MSRSGSDDTESIVVLSGPRLQVPPGFQVTLGKHNDCYELLIEEVERTTSQPPLQRLPVHDTYAPQTVSSGMATYHVCRLCLRKRSNRYHEEHPIVPGMKPPPPSICRRCRVSSDGEMREKVDIEHIEESAPVRLGLQSFLPKEAVLTHDQVRQEAGHREADFVVTRTRDAPCEKDIVLRYVTADGKPYNGTVSESVSTQNVKALGEINSGLDEASQEKIDQGLSTTAKQKRSAVIVVKDRQSTDSKRQGLTESEVRHIAHDEVARYRQAERKVEAHPKAFTHGRMLPLQQQVMSRTIEKDIRDCKRPTDIAGVGCDGCKVSYNAGKSQLNNAAPVTSKADMDRGIKVQDHEKTTVDHGISKTRIVVNKYWDGGGFRLDKAVASDATEQQSKSQKGQGKDKLIIIDEDNNWNAELYQRINKQREDKQAAEYAREHEPVLIKEGVRSSQEVLHARHDRGISKLEKCLNDVPKGKKEQQIQHHEKGQTMNQDDNFSIKCASKTATITSRQQSSPCPRQDKLDILANDDSTVLRDLNTTDKNSRQHGRRLGNNEAATRLHQPHEPGLIYRPPASSISSPSTWTDKEYWHDNEPVKTASRHSRLTAYSASPEQLRQSQRHEREVDTAVGLQSVIEPASHQSREKTRQSKHIPSDKQIREQKDETSRQYRSVYSDNSSQQPISRLSQPSKQEQKQSQAIYQAPEYEYEYMEKIIQPADRPLDSRPFDDQYPTWTEESEVIYTCKPRCFSQAVGRLPGNSSISQAPSKTSIRAETSSAHRPRDYDIVDREKITQVRFSNQVGVSPTPPASDDYPPSHEYIRGQARRAERRSEPEQTRGRIPDRNEMPPTSQHLQGRSPGQETETTVPIDRRPLARALAESPSREKYLTAAERRGSPPRRRGNAYDLPRQYVDYHGPYRYEKRDQSMEAVYDPEESSCVERVRNV